MLAFLIAGMLSKGSADPDANSADTKLPSGSADSATAADAAATGAQAAQSAKVRRSLEALPLVRGSSSKKYARNLFGQAWDDVDGNGCDTRNDVLGRDLRDIVFKNGTGKCKVVAGTLEDWYSGTTINFTAGSDTSRLVQIDHVVPLSWAWHHGADAWGANRRREFANDPLNLVATTDKMNQAKSDHGPAEWLPGDDAALCRYAQRFTAVLSAYELGIDLRNRAMLRGILAECAAGSAFGEFSRPL